MRKLLTSSIVISLLSATSLATNANDYTVQIGAYQVLTNQAISKAEQHGEVYQSIGNDNLTRLHVGRFVSKADAVNKRDQLRSSGYNLIKNRAAALHISKAKQTTNQLKLLTGVITLVVALVAHIIPVLVKTIQVILIYLV